MFNIYQPYKAKVISSIRESEDNVLLRLKFSDQKIQKDFNFLPGQFMQISLPGWGECPISICSSPYYSSQYFELAIRDVGQLTHKLNSLIKNDEVWIRGPFGNGFDCDIFLGKQILIVGGGCGLIPLRPIIHDYLAGRLKGSGLQIFYGCKNEKTLLFKKEYPAWNRNSEFIISLENPSLQWKGNKGMITSIIKKKDIKPDSIALVVGPPVMYKFVIAELMKKKIKAENIYLSLERKMYCGNGVCQHCAIGPYYVCKDGPVFRWSDIKKIPEII